MWNVIVKDKFTGEAVCIPCNSLELAENVKKVVYAYQYTVDIKEVERIDE